MRNIKLILEYDGTNYCGWQRQLNGVSVEETLEKVIRNLFGEDIRILGASRTDSGVHALGQVVSFSIENKIPVYKIPGAINVRLPKDIVVIEAEEVDEDFHPIYSAKRKKYVYKIINRRVKPALMRNYYWHVGYKLDIENMKKACAYILGEHDFSAFKSNGGSTLNSIRTVYSLDIVKEDDYITVSIEGNGFLYNMVRIIVGTLIEVGRGRINPDDIKDIIESKNRQKAGITAKPYGLYLEKVYY